MNRQPRHAIEAQDIADYRRDGVVCLRDQFDEDWLALLREQTELAMTTPGPNAEEYTQPGKPGRYFGDLDLSQRWAGFRRFVLESPAAEIAGHVMASGKVNFFYDQLLVKEPGTQERTPWHQDQPYWAVVGRDVCSIWLPLDPVSKSASLSYVIGSHAWGSAFNPQHFKDGTAYQGKGLPPLPDIDADPERYALSGWDMEPGDCLVFQAMIVHGSGGNLNTLRRRRAYSTRWTGDDARYWRGQGEVAIPTSSPGLKDGDPLDCDLFPVVWRNGNATP